MKKYFFLVVFATAATALYSFKQFQSSYNNIFEQLGWGTEEAESYIAGNIVDGSTSFPSSKIMTSLAMNKREEAVKAIGSYVRAYVQSSAFQKAYATTRLEQKPEAPTGFYKNAENTAFYKEELKRWEAEYPAVFNELLKRRLKEFLHQTSGIDFSAKLVRSGSKMVFADPSLENKDLFWKACFRSGKATVDAARDYALQWLSELSAH